MKLERQLTDELFRRYWNQGLSFREIAEETDIPEAQLRFYAKMNGYVSRSESADMAQKGHPLRPGKVAEWRIGDRIIVDIGAGAGVDRHNIHHAAGTIIGIYDRFYLTEVQCRNGSYRICQGKWDAVRL